MADTVPGSFALDPNFPTVSAGPGGDNSEVNHGATTQKREIGRVVRPDGNVHIMYSDGTTSLQGGSTTGAGAAGTTGGTQPQTGGNQ